MPVHCYGKPVNMDAIQAIADKYGLKVIYDAAHAFGVEVNGESVLNRGDMSTLSFHATKVYNTLEGGASWNVTMFSLSRWPSAPSIKYL